MLAQLTRAVVQNIALGVRVTMNRLVLSFVRFYVPQRTLDVLAVDRADRLTRAADHADHELERIPRAARVIAFTL